MRLSQLSELAFLSMFINQSLDFTTLQSDSPFLHFPLQLHITPPKRIQMGMAGGDRLSSCVSITTNTGYPEREAATNRSTHHQLVMRSGFMADPQNKRFCVA